MKRTILPVLVMAVFAVHAVASAEDDMEKLWPQSVPCTEADACIAEDSDPVMDEILAEEDGADMPETAFTAGTPDIEITAIEQIDAPAYTVSQKGNKVMAIAESNDLYTFWAGAVDEDYAVDMIQSILPSHVTAILEDGQRISVTLSGKWVANREEHCFMNAAASIPAGVVDSGQILSDIRIYYKPDTSANAFLYYEGAKMNNALPCA